MEFSALLSKMLIFISLMVIGYCLARYGVCGPGFTKTASWIVMNVFMIGTILSSMISTGMESDVSDLAEIMLLTFVMTLIGYVVAAIMIRVMKIDSDHAPVCEVLMSTGNSMFIALPIAQSIYGSYAVLIVSLSCIPFNLLLYSYGVWRMNNHSEGGHARFKDIMSLPMIATLLGLVFVALKIPVPAPVMGIFTALSGATMPMSMIVIGASLGSVSLFDAFRNPKFIFVSAVRLVLIPVITWFICRFLTADNVLLMTCTIIAAAPSAVLVSVLAIQYGRDAVFSSEGVQHSTICSMITIPLLIQFLSHLS